MFRKTLDLEELRKTALLNDKQNFAKLSNHPVHLDKNDLSTSALIPFCSFGKEYLKEDKIETFLCDSFKPKIRKNQICYETSFILSKENGKSVSENFREGIFLAMNANEEKQTVFNDVNVTEKNNQEERNDIQIFTNTIGMLIIKYNIV